MNNLIIKQVPFENIIMTACKTTTGKVLVGIKSICQGLGIDYSSQLKRIDRDDVLPEGVVKMTIPTQSGDQETNMLDIEYLPFFLTGIKSSMCREEVRTKLINFKLKAKDVLAEAFLKKPQCIEDVLIQSLQEMKEVKQQLNQVNHKMLETKEEVQAIREVVTINPKAAWRRECNRILNAIGKKVNNYSLPKDEVYQALKERGNCRPNVLINNLKKRAQANGMAPSKVEKINILDVLENEPRLKEIYVVIVKEMAIKHDIRIKES